MVLVNYDKDNPLKKSKNIINESPSAASMIMGDPVEDNFKNENIVSWSKRGKTEVSSCLKQALGETFFHGLDLLNSFKRREH